MSKLDLLCIRIMTTIASLKNEEGQGLIEYSLIAALISIAAIVIMTTVGGNIKTVFTNVSNALT